MPTAIAEPQRAYKFDNVLENIGNTPLIRLNRSVAHLGPSIYA